MRGKVIEHMDRAELAGVDLAHVLHGSGEPVVLIHWGVCAAWAQPLLEAPALSERYRLLSHHRAGFGDSGRIAGPISIADHADHCRQLMHHLGIQRAHVVGHSSSAAIALQLALDAPEAVHTLVLMDAARPAPQTETQAQFGRDVVAPAVARYRAGDTPAAVDIWCQGVFGRGYRPALDQGLPDAFEQAVADADAFFGQELPALQRWSFTDEDARRVDQPVLVVLGEHSASTFGERHDLLLSWLPDVEPLGLPDASHLLHVQNPDRMAEALVAFFARHPAPDGTIRGASDCSAPPAS